MLILDLGFDPCQFLERMTTIEAIQKGHPSCGKSCRKVYSFGENTPFCSFRLKAALHCCPLKKCAYVLACTLARCTIECNFSLNVQNSRVAGKMVKMTGHS